MSSTSFKQRAIDFIFQLGEGSFGESGSNKQTVSGLRSFVQVSQAVTPTPSQCLITVYGLTLDTINSLTKAGLSFQSAANYVAVQAGNKGEQLTTIFNGTIYEAFPQFQEQPNGPFIIIANPAAVIQLKPTKAQSFNGTVSTETALNKILSPAGYTVENNGVSAMLAYPYFPGTVWQQARRCIEAADAYAYWDAINKKVAIWPKKGQRSTQPFTCSPDTGMIGYPEFMQNRIRVRMPFDPSLKGPGQPIKVESQLKAANGNWVLDQIDYAISAEAPDGPWEMSLIAHPGTPNG